MGGSAPGPSDLAIRCPRPRAHYKGRLLSKAAPSRSPICTPTPPLHSSPLRPLLRYSLLRGNYDGILLSFWLPDLGLCGVLDLVRGFAVDLVGVVVDLRDFLF